ncbi:conserved hypothetical protein [Talaromyces marneffei ATCC 18224]|uniref:Zn(2)-C6 fungal-type domain-containing protein n=1 Tax=Talaromyces marneffei (strain ATCC 18224 / CBS 334.59 / QM 7333) TaxID=441960 RepID=B6Q5X3_TALMQ|nr:conserved hypothetical protein [Talaromyces marneffei ATCC 18224]
MPRVKPGERRRAYRPKTLRRVKCDEAKPVCHNCTVAARQCLGYNNYSSAQSLLQSESHTSVHLNQVVSAPFTITDAEQHAFEYYRARTSSHLSGIQDHEFWERLLLQRAQIDAGVRHAIIALASFHEDFERGMIENVRSKEQFGLKQYNLAIREQMSLATNGNKNPAEPEAYLPCIVFVTIENMQMLRANFAPALYLAKKVISLLHDLRKSDQTSKMLLEFLERRFRQIELQASEMFGSTAYSSILPSQPTKVPILIPPIFASLSEARSAMEYYGQLYRMTVDASEIGSLSMSPDEMKDYTADPDPRSAFAVKYLSILKRWTSAFDAFLEGRAGSFTVAEMRTVRILRMQQLHSQISIEVSTRYTCAENQMFWDDYCPVYEEMINLIEAILATEGPEGDLTTRNASFSLDLVTIGPIYDLARRCRDPQIRRKALEVLRTCHRREGMWDSELALLVIERVIAIEEDGISVQSCKDIPNWRRILHIQHLLDMEARTIHLKYERVASATRPVVVQMQEVITW